MLPPPLYPSFERFGDRAKQFALYTLLKKVCRQAYFTSQKGHHLKAVKLMNDRYVPKNHELFCRVKAHLCLQVFAYHSQNNDEYLSLKDKYKYLKEALWFAELAVSHNPFRTDYVFFFASLLYCRYIYDLFVQPTGRPLEINSRRARKTYCFPPEKNIAGVKQGLCDLVINECRNINGGMIGDFGDQIKEHELEDFMVSKNKNWLRKPNEVERALRLTPKKRRRKLKLKQKKVRVRVPAAAELIRSCRRQQKSGLLTGRSDCQQKCVLPQRNAKFTVCDFHSRIPCQVR
ncbi:hypothetical protein AQUCO_12000015v1 [Aquilegia coerulea]|uniref:Uncharacterized protein n=1 Tax=Aquilegia coerulea TaxID=218851 RepID=A0A2G5C1U8_AQUCA|nr:hypothetical protein AQUCO_12000015v1 [Aquilegia coerulea]